MTKEFTTVRHVTHRTYHQEGLDKMNHLARQGWVRVASLPANNFDVIHYFERELPANKERQCPPSQEASFGKFAREYKQYCQEYDNKPQPRKSIGADYFEDGSGPI